MAIESETRARSILGALAPAGWLRLPRRTARLRLTLLYSALFLLLGTGLLAIVYLFAAHGGTVTALRESVGRVIVRRVGPQGVPVPETAVAQHTADTGRLLTVSWIVLAATTVLSGLLGWLAAGRVLRPVRVMATTARTISAGNLHERLAVAGPDDEFKQLGDTLDDLFGRLEASFEAQRRFVANASHELRTPLTLERTLLELALADPNANAHSLRATCEELLASSRDQERLLESLLTLTSSERGLEYREPMDLSEIVEQALVGMRAAAKDESLTINAQLEPAPAEGDTTLVARLVGNLIDNATPTTCRRGTSA